jgi:putative heme iron utilization protein
VVGGVGVAFDFASDQGVVDRGVAAVIVSLKAGAHLLDQPRRRVGGGPRQSGQHHPYLAAATTLGDADSVSGPVAPARQLVHPDFKDFNFWRLEVAAVRYIGGYGRMSWVSVVDWLAAQSDPVVPFAEGIITHMNEDHADGLPLYCRAFSRATEFTTVTMTGIDRYGFEMSAVTPDGPRPIRVAFAEQISSRGKARTALVAMLGDARAKLGGS